MESEIRNTAPENIQEQLQQIGREGFRFACHPGVPCFTECCRDLNLLLTPYDVLRLKNRLGISSGDFLDRYAECRFDENRNLPKMYLKMSENEDRTCPFVTVQGCSVYEDRPSACRIYPVARAARVHRVHNTVLENYFLLKEDHCRGFEEERSWTTGEWLQDQGLESYHESNDSWMEIITHPKLRDATLSPQQQQVLYLGSYNTDKFRQMILGSKFFTIFDISDEEAEKIQTDESELLSLAFRWIKFAMFGESGLRKRQERAEQI